ncbi:MAG TPA: hypothetical protein VES20_03410, partial [Bryobacteraceae bacterium]|nr:hypothetical protein [Bryobacteraceae bacterium]
MSENGYLTWEAAGSGPRLRIADAVVRGISAEAMRGFGATRRRGAEVGGLLLGYPPECDGQPFHIDGFIPVPCQYAHGPSYVLSDSDHEALAAAARAPSARRSGAVVGFYRSHTRDGMEPDTADAALWSRHFGKMSDGLVLLVKPFATRAPVARVAAVVGGCIVPAGIEPE